VSNAVKFTRMRRPAEIEIFYFSLPKAYDAGERTANAP
jgi:hypothetical protein